MGDERPPIEQLLDLVLYAPIGLAVQVQEALPDLVREGRRRAEQRIVLARFLGKMAVHVGKQELAKRIDEIRSNGPSAMTTITNTTAMPHVATVDVVDTTASDADTADLTTTADESVTPTTVVSADDLAIAGYDCLSASQVVGRLAALSADELDALAAYEAANRSRRTILAKVAQLRSREA